MSLQVDRIKQNKIEWNSDYVNPNAEAFRDLEDEAVYAVSQTCFRIYRIMFCKQFNYYTELNKENHIWIICVVIINGKWFFVSLASTVVFELINVNASLKKMLFFRELLLLQGRTVSFSNTIPNYFTNFCKFLNHVYFQIRKSPLKDFSHFFDVFVNIKMSKKCDKF